MFKGVLASLVSVCLMSFGAATVNAAGLVEQKLDYSDHLQELHNPARGTTHHKGFYLRPGKALDLKSNGTVYNDFMRFLIDLGGFSSNAWEKDADGNKVSRGVSQPLDEVSLNNVRAALDSLRRRGGACTIRASYDIDCRGSQDPDVETTLIHTKQLAELYSDYEDVIHFVELGMFGTCGEMTTGGQDNHAKALQTFLENSSDGIKVGVRSPQVVALWMGLKDPYSTWHVFPDFRADSERFQDSTRSERYARYMDRVGLYNDGYLGSDNDLGTFGAGEPYPISRENVISWMEEFGVAVPYGGDFVCNYNPETRPPLNTAEYLSYEGFRTHTSYIGGSMAGKCYNFMDTTTFTGIDPEYGGKVKGREYVRDHLGYRFVLRKSALSDSSAVGGKLQLKLNIQNVGFANNLTAGKATLILKPALSEVADDVVEIPLSFDPRHLNSRKLKMKESKNPTGLWTGKNFSDLYDTEKPEFDGVNEISEVATLPADLTLGEYKAYLRFSHYGDFKTDNNFHVIQFANDSSYYDGETGSNYIGKFQLVEKLENPESIGYCGPKGCDNKSQSLKSVSIQYASGLLRVFNAAQVEIFNTRGQRLFRQTNLEKSSEIPLRLNPGIYIVKASGLLQTFVVK